MKSCPYCNNTVDDVATFCPKCGKSLNSNGFKTTMGATGSTKKCPYCGAVNNASSGFCSNCGKALNVNNPGASSGGMKTCPYCGTNVNPSNAFCPNCGRSFGSPGGTGGYVNSPPMGASDLLRTKAILSLVLSIVGILIGFIPYVSFISFPMTIVSLVMAVQCNKAYKEMGVTSGLSTAAFIIGLIVVIIAAIQFVSCGLCVLCAGGSLAALSSSLSSYY